MNRVLSKNKTPPSRSKQQLFAAAETKRNKAPAAALPDLTPTIRNPALFSRVRSMFVETIDVVHAVDDRAPTPKVYSSEIDFQVLGAINQVVAAELSARGPPESLEAANHFVYAAHK